MKQLLHDLSNGQIKLQEVPCPQVTPGHLLVRTGVSLVSAGTERMLLEFGKANLLNKARQQPERVKEAWDKVKTDGLLPTLEAVRAKLDEPITLGYCNVGEVLEVGAGVDGFAAGDRVVSNGSHAEVVLVSANLCAQVPPPVSRSRRGVYRAERGRLAGNPAGGANIRRDFRRHRAGIGGSTRRPTPARAWMPGAGSRPRPEPEPAWRQNLVSKLWCWPRVRTRWPLLKPIAAVTVWTG